MFRVIIILKGRQVASARNLEVLGRYHRQDHYAHPVAKATATKLPRGEGLLRIRYSNGAKSEVKFGSYGILKGWLDSKRKRAGWA